jgi:hypothetical protein
MWDDDDWSEDYAEPSFNWFNIIFVLTGFTIYIIIYLVFIYIKIFFFLFTLSFIILYKYNKTLYIKNKKSSYLNYNTRYYKKKDI